jgi:hypothetical protein
LGRDEGTEALFGSTWGGPRICGHAHTGPGQASRVASRRLRSCKRSVLRSVKRADGRDRGRMERQEWSWGTVDALQPATAFLMFGDRFPRGGGSGVWASETLAFTRAGSAEVENRKAAMDPVDAKTNARKSETEGGGGFRQPWRSRGKRGWRRAAARCLCWIWIWIWRREGRSASTSAVR